VEGYVQRSVEDLSKEKQKIFNNTLNHFQVNTEEIPDRVKLLYIDDGQEQLWIDDKLVITFSPLSVDLDGMIKMDYIEHYRRSKNEI
jgi:hypothetical protein